MSTSPVPRRTFLAAAVGAGAALALGSGPRPGLGTTPTATRTSGEAVKLGVASYSLRRFTREHAIRMVAELGTPYINIKSFHLDYDLSPSELQAGRREFEAAGLRIVGGGTITFDEDSDAGVRRYFEYAKHSGMPLIVAAGNPSVLPRLERFAREYDIKVAIHNHGPEDRHYPSPYDALRYIRDMDPRMGLCVDIGHTVRTGVDVVQAIADAGPRVLDLHIKDLRDLSDPQSQVIVGEGNIPIPAIFRQLTRMGYQGYANLEYEIDADDPMPGMQRSFAYMRGVLAGMAES